MCSGYTCTPQGGGINCLRRNLQGKFVSALLRTRSAHPGRAGVNVYDIFSGRVRFLGLFSSLALVLDRLLRSTTKINVNFLRKNVHPRQNSGYAYDSYIT